ncbi:hypothetical protein [Dethiothermospora halolimnae]|uniref:hypothetical protein n=1 Tax=Dethiothermospora halolimnae TaxID=3114390 RepID=UPI003CCBE3B7
MNRRYNEDDGYNAPQQPQPMMPSTPRQPSYMYPPASPYGPNDGGAPNRQPMPMPSRGESPVDFEFDEGPPVIRSPLYLQGYLRRVIGQYVKVQFIVGTNLFIDREGTLLSVGVDHIVLQEPETDDRVICDLYSIKFVKVFY